MCGELGRAYSRDYEQEMMDFFDMYGIQADDLLQQFLCYFSSDNTCACLEDYIVENDLEQEFESYSEEV